MAKTGQQMPERDRSLGLVDAPDSNALFSI
jgi:hypothetical protein